MSYIGKNPKFNTGTFLPQSAQPTNPVEGMIYYDDGTTNTEGVYKYQNSAWEFIGSLVDHLKLNPLAADPLTPVNGQIFYSDGTARAEGLWEYNNGAWQRVGGQNSDLSVLRQFDAEDQDLTGFTNIAINSSSPIDGEYQYSVTSFTASFPTVSIAERNQNKENAVELHYKMTSGTAKLVVKDNAANVLEELQIEATSTASKVVVPFFVSTSVTSVQLEIEDVSSATGLLIDDVVFTDTPFSLANLNQVSEWIDGGTWTITSTGTNPTKGTTNLDQIWYRRVGGDMHIRGEYRQTAGGSAGTGGYLIGIPGGYSIDTTKVAEFGTAPGSQTMVQSTNTVGHGFITASGLGENAVHNFYVFDATNLATTGTTKTFMGNWGQSWANLGDASTTVSFYVIVPIDGWSETVEHVITPAKSNLSNWETENTIPITATVSSPTKGTVTRENIRWRRIGDSAEIFYEFESTAAGTAGSGTYLIGLPAALSGLTIDTSKVHASTAAEFESVVGFGHLSQASNGLANFSTDVQLKVYDTTTLVVALQRPSTDNKQLWDSSFLGFDNTQKTFSWRVVVPIAEWNSDAEFLAAVPVQRIAYIKDVKGNGVASQSLTSGVDNIRDLNTVEGDSSIISLSSNQIVLQPGRYEIDCHVPANNTAEQKAYFYNVSDSTYDIIGTTGYDSGALNTESRVIGRIEITTAKTYEIRQRTALSGTGGITFNPVSQGNVYTQVRIIKIK